MAHLSAVKLFSSTLSGASIWTLAAQGCTAGGASARRCRPVGIHHSAQTSIFLSASKMRERNHEQKQKQKLNVLHYQAAPVCFEQMFPHLDCKESNQILFIRKKACTS